MSPAEPTPCDDDFSRLLAACDEALAAGHAAPTPPELAAPPALQARLERARACLLRLDHARRRSVTARTSADTPLPSDCVTEVRPPPIQALGRFQVRRELGRGGGGIVFLAFDPVLRREVAVKVPRPEAILTPELRRRFLREARAAAGLEHPNLVTVHEVGEDGPLCYLVSTYCRGPSLSAWLKERRAAVPPRDAAALVATLADAVHFMHGRGIIHRDIKPGNVLLQGDKETRRGGDMETEEGSVSLSPPLLVSLSTAIPKLTDFGLARPAERDDVHTRSGAVLGTPAYMAPEQAEGGDRVGPATDIYALGVLLYELLTGQPPFKADTSIEVLRQVVHEEPVPPRRINRAIPSELETIVLKAIEKDPAGRYATAKELAEDLRRFLADEPIRARPAPRLRRLWKWTRRRPARSTAVVLLLAFMAIAFLYRPPPPTPADMEERAEHEYRSALAPFVRELQQGRSVSLIGKETTGSVPHRWRHGHGNITYPEHLKDGKVSVSAVGPILLELLQDTGIPAYRLVVELRHEKYLRDNDRAEVAVAFAYSEYVTAEGPQLIFARATFADLGPRATMWKDQAGRPASLFQLGLYHLGASRLGVDRTHAFGGPPVFYQPAAVARRPGPWRRLEVEVRANRFQARHWDGAVVEMAPADAVPRALRAFRWQSPDLGVITPPLASCNAAGLFIEGSTVSLRRFDVEPLAEGE